MKYDSKSALVLGAVTAALFTATDAAAQRQLWNFTSPTSGSAEFGRVVTPLGDVDGDLSIDYAVSGPGVTLGGNGAGAVVAYSGATGAPLWPSPAVGAGSWVPCGGGGGTAGDYFGAAMALVPDADGDGLDDLAVGAPFFGQVSGGCRIPFFGRLQVLSSATGAPIAGRTRVGAAANTFYGEDVARVQDVDADGVDDYIVLNGSSFDAISGATGVAFFTAPVPAGTTRICGAGDFNGDGFPFEFAFGEPSADSVTILDITTSTTTVFTGPANSSFGAVLARDGNRVLIGAPDEGPSQAGAVYALYPSGPIQFAAGAANERLGASLAAGGNADEDLALDDILVGAPGASAVVVLDEDGVELTRIVEAGAGSYGDSVAWGGDTNLNGYDEIMGGALQGSGQAFVHLGGSDAVATQSYGPGCSPAGAPPSLVVSAPMRLGTSVTATMTGADPFQNTVLYLGRTSPTGIVFGGCTLFIDPSFGPYTADQGLTTAAGARIFAPVPIPVDPSIIGLQMTLQAVTTLPGGGLEFTNAYASTIGW